MSNMLCSIESMVLLFRSTKWRYIVVDEGHRMKNMHCRLIRELKQYQASNKLLLTGSEDYWFDQWPVQ